MLLRWSTALRRVSFGSLINYLPVLYFYPPACGWPFAAFVFVSLANGE